jgi:protocatechuate 3,4-dioxygenase beta subunit
MSGTIFQADGKTPAPGVVMYFYHTNQKGIYPTRGDEQGNAKRHGYLRGWVKTGTDGRYAFYTMRPASYPNSRALAHIHATIKEQGKSAYYIEDFFFADDPFLPDEDFGGRKPRGGNGVVTMKTDKDGISYGSRNITLGLNIPGYK